MKTSVDPSRLPELSFPMDLPAERRRLILVDILDLLNLCLAGVDQVTETTNDNEKRKDQG